jgi:hypothetical protein
LIEIIVMVKFVMRKPAIRCEQAYPGHLHAGVLKVKDENGSDLAVRQIDVLARLPLHVLAGFALRDLADQRGQSTRLTE